MTELTQNLNKITKNSLAKLIGLIVVITSTVVTIAVFIISNFYAGQINELKSNIERLTPSSGNSSDIDLSKFFV